MVDAKTFRDAMSRLAAAVNIITSNGPGGLSGCTASAVCSVSDEPPILLVCINRASRNNAVFKKNGRLCVNVLRAGQQDIAMLFAKSLGDASAHERFIDAAWSDEKPRTLEKPGTVEEQHATLPALTSALVSLDCDITDSAEVGSHTVFYCHVEHVRIGTEGPALLYYERSFQPLPHPLASIAEHAHPR